MVRRTIKFSALAVFTVYFIAFSIANREVVSVSLFPMAYSADMPLFLLALLCFSLGALIAGFWVNLKFIKTKRILSGEHKRVMALQNELAGLKAERSPNLPTSSFKKSA